MEKQLIDRLKDYKNSDMYPFHMPGHKRTGDFPNPYEIDITEIEGFDNLHHPEGILKDSMEWAASVYGADKTYYLVNGSSGGILSAISGLVPFGGKILMARNCHKSVYHGVILGHLSVEYIYPQIAGEFGVQGGLLASDVEQMLISHGDIHAVLIVSPTYDGMVSDVKAIAEAAHKMGIPLIVDEAHGAHFCFGDMFPVSALNLGADVVIQSLHKTLPSFTQTALLHVKRKYVEIGRLERYLQIYQSSSPSYILMAGIERCIGQMVADHGLKMKTFIRWLTDMRTHLLDMKRLCLLDRNLRGSYGIYDTDISKIVVSCLGTSLSGAQLSDILRKEYHLEMEMCGADYVTAITTVCDSREGLIRLERALMEIDGRLIDENTVFHQGHTIPALVSNMALWEAMDAVWEPVCLGQCEGRISGEFIYIYPPGIPVVAPGEEITAELIELIAHYKKLNLPVQGTADSSVEMIRVVRDIL